MEDVRSAELLNVILDLRNATDLGFAGVYPRFDAVDRRFDQMEERSATSAVV
jgi:hypothetical protein